MKKMLNRGLMVLCCACMFSTAVNSVNVAGNRWFTMGPGGGGSMYSPTISPVDKDCMTVSCDMGAYYVTTNGGKKWIMAELNELAYISAFDTKDPKTVYAGSDSLYRSTDGGQTWEDILGKTTRGDYKPVMVAVDPDDNKIIYLGLGSGTSLEKFLVSSDRGKSWEKAGALLPFGSGFTAIFLDGKSPEGARVIYIATSRGIYRSQNGGDSFTSIDSSLPAKEIELFAGGSDKLSQKTVICAGIRNEGLYKSADAGKSWRKISGVPVPNGGGFSLVMSAQNPDVMYYSAFVKGVQYVYKSEDSGNTWKSVVEPGNTKKQWISNDSGWGNGFPIHDLGISPVDANVACYVDSCRFTRTTDGGKTWEEIYSLENESNYWASAGLEITTSYGVHFDPKNKNRRYITYTDMGLFRSVDAGYSWKYIGAGWNTFYWLEIDPANPDRLYGAVSDVHDLPESKMFKDVNSGTGGVLISENAGTTWKRCRDGLPTGPATWILLDPKSPAEKRILYAAICGKGVYKSLDSGKTWFAVNKGLGPNFNTLKIAMSDEGILYLVVTRSAGGSGALYKSADGGANWERLNKNMDFGWITDIAVHPQYSQILYVSCYGYGPSKGGVYRSDDYGETWARVLDKEYIYGITVDKRDPELIYAGYNDDDNRTPDRGAYVSRDRGNTWGSVFGIPFRNAHRVIIDPDDIEQLYVTTFGGGVLTNKEPQPGIKIAEEPGAGGGKIPQGPKKIICDKIDAADYKIKIDGKLDEPLWKAVKPAENFMYVGGEIPDEKTFAQVAYDVDKLYIAFECGESKIGKIKKKYPKTMHDGDLWEDDGVEVFIDAKPENDFYYHLIITANGAVYEAKHNKDRDVKIVDDASWNPLVKAETGIKGDGYVVELSIPFMDLGIPYPKSGLSMGFNLNRNRYAVEEEYFTWAELSPKSDYHEPKKFGKLVLR